MKLPSLAQTVEAAERALRRFPLVLAAALAGTVAAMSLIGEQDTTGSPTAFRVLWGALLGFPLLTALALLAEKRHMRRGAAWGLQAAGLVATVAYAATLPGDIELAPEMHGMRLAMLLAAAWLFVTVAPWLGRGEDNGFWQYNKTLFVRAALAALFTGVLFAGLAIALAAVENLFDIPVPGERYGQLFALLAGLVATWFFLAGLPEDFDALLTAEEYPKGLKVFAQYVMLPLVAVYLLILAAYAGKIILAWDWPYGWVSRLILGFAAAGLSTMLVLHPLRERDGGSWITTASRVFFIALAPLLVMYFLAVLRRLSDYGLTEGRYLAIATGLWLAAVMLYFLLGRGKNIKLIPLSLAVLVALLSVGPWGAFSVSEGSQVARLRAMLEHNALLADGRVVKAGQVLPAEDVREISAVLQYLHIVHGYAEIQPWFASSLRDDSQSTNSDWMAPTDVADLLGIEYRIAREISPRGDVMYDASRTDPMVVAGFDVMLPDRHVDARETQPLVVGEATVVFDDSLGFLRLILADEADDGADTLRISFAPLLDTLTARYDGGGASEIPLERMAVDAASSTLRARVYVLMLQRVRRDAAHGISAMRYRLLYARPTATGDIPFIHSSQR